MKVLNFKQKEVSSSNPEISEVISVNFRTKEVTKSVETSNKTGRVISSYEVIDVKPTLMGEGFGDIINILLKKNA